MLKNFFFAKVKVLGEKKIHGNEEFYCKMALKPKRYLGNKISFFLSEIVENR
jgi:hypothetical protein